MLSRIIRKIRTIIWTNLSLVKVQHGEKIFVNKKSKFTSFTVLGNNCHFNGIKITGEGKVKIGNNFHSGSNILMLTSYHNYDKGNALPYDDTFIVRDIVIEDNVWLGENVTVLAGVRIGEGAIIQAGSVVVSDIPPFSIAGGHPAVVFKQRDVQHYNELKSKNKFM